MHGLIQTTRTLPLALCLAGLTLFSVAGCSPEPSGHDESDHHNESEHDYHGGDLARGPHGGRMFADANVQLELRIEEEDGPPTFIVYLYDGDGERRSPEGADVTVALDRFAGRRDIIRFAPAGNHLRGDGIVREPHSFKVAIDLQVDGETFQWQYEQVEFRVALSPEAVKRSGIEIGNARPAHIDVRVNAPGEVRLNGERMLIVRPRFAGVVTELRKQLGDAVATGETIAVIQSNESLTEYTIKSPMAGRIVARSGMIGSSVDNQSVLYTLADLSTVWVDFAIYPQHVGVIERGQPVEITAATRPDLVAVGEVSYVGPLLEQDTRVSHGRIVVPNTDGHWQPGLYVIVSAVVDHAETAIAVPDDAIIRSKFGPAVFLVEGSTFELQPVTPGRTDGGMTEIIEGLEHNAAVVVKNTFLLKAELGRSEATHDH